MKVETWCSEHGITKVKYYYRLKQERKACLEVCNPAPSFIELPKTSETMPSAKTCDYKQVAILRDSKGLALKLYNHASSDIIRSLLEILVHVEWCNRPKKGLSCRWLYGPAQGIDGLATMIRFRFQLDPYDKNTLFYSVARKQNALKAFYGKMMGLCCSIRDQTMVRSAGLALQKMLWKYHQSSMRC